MAPPDPEQPSPRPLDPADPLAGCQVTPFEPEGLRSLLLWGAPVELVLVPHRAARPGIPGAARPAIRPSPVERILTEEIAAASGTAADGLAVTTNRYPFARDAGLLWRRRAGQREPDGVMFAALAAAARGGTTAIWNTVGAAASIPRSHAHLTRETQPFLGALPWDGADGPWADALRERVPGLSVQVVAEPVAVWLIQLQGAPEQLATGLLHLQDMRAAAAMNGVLSGDRAWLMPRSTVETPAPHFPFPLGGAELWGRWCYPERASFDQADEAALAEAFAQAGCPRPKPA